MSSRWICCQIGAREHYAVARALRRAKRPTELYTDFWASQSVRSIASKSPVKFAQALAARFHHELIGDSEAGKGMSPAVSIHSWNMRSLAWEWGARRKSKAASGGAYFGFIEVGKRFSIRVREALNQRTDLGADTILFAYDTGALETMEWCRARANGIKCVLNQMDPSRVEVDLVKAEAKLWPGWESQPVEVPEAYFQRRQNEWALADRIVVNSEFSRKALLQQGVSAHKLVVIPLCYETAENRSDVEIGNQKGQDGLAKAGQPLRVLFLGQVILRKGIQYLMAAAKQLERENIHFDVVGSIGISKEAIASAPRNMTFHGRTPRDQAAVWYRKSDVFVLPTLSDGFAITQLEAMAHGLPVVATPCCGEVVTDGTDGFVVPARDADALVKVFQRYLTSPQVLSDQSQAAHAKAKQFTVGRLAENLVKLEAGLKDL